MKIKTIGILLLLLTMYPVFSLAHDIKIEGRIFTESAPMKDAKVFVYKNYKDINAEKPFLVSNPSDGQGVYSIKLPAGEYYFIARGEKEGKEFFAYHGNNPIPVEKENIWLSLMINESKPPVYSDGDMLLKGVVTYKGKPVTDAYIAIYTPETRSFKGLGYRTESINRDGTFSLSLLEGRYVIIAKKMQGDKMIRPLKEGDLYCYYPQNPVEIRTDKTVGIEVPCYPKGDRISFVDVPVIKENDYMSVLDLTERFKSGFKGKVRDLKGNPVAGIYVFAYRSRAAVFLSFHISQGSEYYGITDKDGNYNIPVDSDGDFHIVARDRLGGAPRAGDVYGVYDGSPDYKVQLKKGQVVENIDIVVGKTDAKAFRNKPEDVLEVDSRDYKTDHIIDRDTVWKGNITINGRVSVKRGVTLTIRPGTVIRFKRIDRDNNRVGDSEIMVQGNIIARGTKENRITFKSAEEKPKPKDWSYILLLASGAESIFEYCEFQHAFSGIQAIYANTSVTDSIFRENHEGIRFTRANAVLENNGFFNNDTAIRHTILEGEVIINKNLIRNNDIGIIFRQAHINTVDFNKIPEIVENLEVKDNNIYDNHRYNVKLGDGQIMDVDVIGNWWGSRENEYIEEYIFDKKQDEELGNVVYSPYRTGLVKDAGVRDKM